MLLEQEAILHRITGSFSSLLFLSAHPHSRPPLLPQSPPPPRSSLVRSWEVCCPTVPHLPLCAKFNLVAVERCPAGCAMEFLKSNVEGNTKGQSFVLEEPLCTWYFGFAWSKRMQNKNKNSDRSCCCCISCLNCTYKPFFLVLQVILFFCSSFTVSSLVSWSWSYELCVCVCGVCGGARQGRSDSSMRDGSQGLFSRSAAPQTSAVSHVIGLWSRGGPAHSPTFPLMAAASTVTFLFSCIQIKLEFQTHTNKISSVLHKFFQRWSAPSADQYKNCSFTFAEEDSV